MQENEFEKQVKNKMDELNFTPSAPVWEAIKKQIEKKKRRVLPFIFLLSFIVIISGYFIYADVINHTEKQNKNHTDLNNDKGNANTSAEINQKEKSNQSNPALPDLKKPQPKILIKEQRLDNSNLSISTSQNYQSKELKNLISIQQEKNNTSKNNKSEFVFQPLIIKGDVTDTTNIFNNKKQTLNANTLKQSNNNFNQNNQHKLNNADSTITKTNTDSLIRINDTITKNDSSKQNEKPALKKKNKNNWQWGITTMYGWSNLNKNLTNSDLSTAKNLYTGVGPLQNNVVQTKHPYKAEKAYKFGITIRRSILNQAYLSTGIQYIHLTNSSTTIRNLDSSLVAAEPTSFDLSSVNGYYRYGSEKTYINKYNFIELPLSIQKNILHGKRFSLSFDAGVSVMHLLSAKSLLYNSKNINFFNDSNLLRKTQFQLLSGLNLQFNTKKSGSFLLGPHIEYSLSTFLKNNYYNKLHYINYGLQASWLFNKK